MKNAEDIKECVNDAFSEFYFQRDKFVPGKSSLSAYLTAIVRNRAVSIYRKEQREKRKQEFLSVEDPGGRLSEN